MKIIYTSPSIDPNIEKRHFLQLALNLKALGHDLVLLVPRYGQNKKEDCGLKTVFIPTLGKESFKSYLLVEFLRFFYLPWLLLKFRPAVVYNRKERLDFAPPFWAFVFRVPYVVEVNGILEKELRIGGYSEWMIGIFKLMEDFNYKIAAQVICVTPGIKNLLLEKYKISEKQLSVVPNGADTELFKPLDKKECRKKLGLSDKFFYIGFIGSFAPWQDLETLIRSAKITKALESVRYILVGSGILEERLRELIKQNNLEEHVFLLNWTEYIKMPLYIGSFDVCYISRIAIDSDFSPLKLYEYLACGRPVIAGRAGGITEAINESKCGFIFEPKNADELAQIIERCFKEQNSLDKLGLAGRQWVESRYSWRISAEKTEKVFKQIISP